MTKMNRTVLIFITVFASVGAFAIEARSEIKTVSSVDVGQYLGTWYQMAHNPMAFEGQCACAQQKLGATATTGTVSVFNSCNDKTPAGPVRSVTGTATSNDSVTNSKFTVDFGFPRKGEYWIIGLDSTYRYAVVTDSRGESLYILSKTTTLDPQLYDEAVALAAQQVNTSKLEVTNQVGCTYP